MQPFVANSKFYEFESLVVHVFSREEAHEPESWRTLSHMVHSGDSCIKYHQGLNIYTLTVGMKEGDQLNMEKDIAQLQLHIQNLQHMVRERVCLSSLV